MTNFSPLYISFPRRKGLFRMPLTGAGVRFLLSFCVPLVLSVIGGLGTWLIVTEFRWSNFYLGTDYALAGISAGLLNFLDMLDAKELSEVTWKILWTVGYLAITLGIYMLLLCMHQNIEKRQSIADEEHVRKKDAALKAGNPAPERPDVGKKLGMLGNIVGLGPSFLFAWLKLKGSL
jgi:hypothetical protein